MPTALIFGTSRGLGKAMVEELLGRGWDVIATVRRRAALDDIACDALTVEELDTTDWLAVDALKAKLAGRPLDLLYVSAAIAEPLEPWGEVEAEPLAHLMIVNVLAPLRNISPKLPTCTAAGKRRSTVKSSPLALR